MIVNSGDILIKKLDSGEVDMQYINGSPEMTEGFESFIYLAVFGRDYWANSIVDTESEKMQSDFPDVIERNVLNDKTRKDGNKALGKALSVMITEKMASKITVTGQILSNNNIGWTVEIKTLTDRTLKYYINWQKGVIDAGLITN